MWKISWSLLTDQTPLALSLFSSTRRLRTDLESLAKLDIKRDEISSGSPS